MHEHEELFPQYETRWNSLSKVSYYPNLCAFILLFYLSTYLAFLIEKPIPGRRDGFEKHIKDCEVIDVRAKARLDAEVTPSRAGSLEDSRHPEGVSPNPYRGATPGDTHLSKELQTRFESDICKLWIANGWSWNSINNPQTRMFFDIWRPEAKLPDRHKLSGPVLRGEVETANALMHNAVKGRIATGMSDGWKNIRRTSLLASMLSVDYKVSKILCM